MKIFVNIGKNWNGDIERALKLVEITHNNVDGYIVEQAEDDLFFADTDLQTLVSAMGKKQKILSPVKSSVALIKNLALFDGIRIFPYMLFTPSWFDSLLSFFDHKKHLIFLDVFGLDEVQINELLKHTDRLSSESANITLLHGNHRYNTELRDINLIHLLQLIEVSLKLDIYPNFGYTCQLPKIHLVTGLALIGVNYLEVFVDLQDGKGHDNIISFTPDMFYELYRAVNEMRIAKSCGCFNVLNDVDYLHNHNEKAK